METDTLNYLWQIPEGASDEEIMKLTERNFKIIQSFQPLYTEDSYKEYNKVYSMGYKRKQDVASAKEALEAQSLLQQTLTVADGVYYLWGDSVGPMADGESFTEEQLDASMPDAYGSYNPEEDGDYVGENPNLPAFYICHGKEDDTIPCQNAQDLYDQISGTTAAELYLVDGAKHGFGPGHTSTAAEGCKVWPGKADEFMQANKGHSGN